VLDKSPVAGLPAAWLDAIVGDRDGGARAEPVAEIIPEGKRRPELLSLAGTMRRRGLARDEILATLRAVNAARCRPPLTDSEIVELADDVDRRYQPAQPLGVEAYTGPARTLDETVATFTGWLHLDDPAPVYAMLGAVAANYLNGCPVWQLLVAPPSSGKTELLGSLGRLPDVYPAAVLSEASLLSGTPAKDRSTGAKGGLLREIGDFGLIICKDFTSVLSMRHDARLPILAALREIYDGSWTRYVGTDGGRKLEWQGKVGLIGGCTPTIDRHHAVMSAMGERLLLFRLPLDKSELQAGRALRHSGDHEHAMRTELTDAVAGLFSGELGTPRELTDHDEQRLVQLATLVARCRSAVERDTYSTREIELVPAPEQPARLALTLERLLAGLDALGYDRQLAWNVVGRAALDSMPALRRAIVDVLVVADDPLTTSEIGEKIKHPTTTARRALEDLTAHDVVDRHIQGEGRADVWVASEWLCQRWPR
jgi:hypothetical protein